MYDIIVRDDNNSTNYYRYLQDISKVLNYKEPYVEIQIQNTSYNV